MVLVRLFCAVKHLPASDPSLGKQEDGDLELENWSAHQSEPLSPPETKTPSSFRERSFTIALCSCTQVLASGLLRVCCRLGNHVSALAQAVWCFRG